MSKLKAQINAQNTLAWAGIALLTALAFYGTYSLQLSGPIKALVWLVWLVVVLGLGYFTSKGKQAFDFSKEAKKELQKVTWPTRQETLQTTFIVMVMVAVTGIVLWGVDSLMMWAVGKITHLS